MTPGHYEGAYQTGNKYDTDQPIRNRMELTNDNKDVKMTARTYYQVKIDYMRSFGKHDVTGLVLANSFY